MSDANERSEGASESFPREFPKGFPKEMQGIFKKIGLKLSSSQKQTIGLTNGVKLRQL